MNPAGDLVQLTRASIRTHPAAQYLGPWCTEKHAHVVVPDSCIADLTEVVAMRKNAYDVSLRVLSAWLNSIHGLQKSEVFWETLVFRFLTLYLDEMVCRYIFTRESKKRTTATFCVLDPRDYYIPENDRSVLDRYDTSDRFNLQLFSQLYERTDERFSSFRSAQFTFPSETRPNPWGRSIVPRAFANWGKRILYLAAPVWIRRTKRFQPQDIVLLPSFFTPTMLEYMSAGESFRFVHPGLGYIFEYDHNANGRIRATLPDADASNEFERLVLRSLRTNIPKDYIENFPAMYRRVLFHIQQSGVPRFIFGNFFPNILERLWMAECKGRGSRILIAQHGGVYGESQKPFWQESELRIADEYLTWGWTSGNTSKIRPMPGTRLLRAKRTPGKVRSDIVFVLRTNYRYPKFMYALKINSDESERTFAMGLSKPARAHTIVRIRADSFSLQELQGRWLPDVPEMTADRSGRNIYEQLDNAKLVVVDYLFSTTFAECVSANIPVIAFAPDQRSLIHPSAQECFDELYKVGVLQPDAASASNLVATIFDDPEAWWMQPERQKAIARYRDAYARTKGGLGAWKAYFASLTKE